MLISVLLSDVMSDPNPSTELAKFITTQLFATQTLEHVFIAS